MNWATRIATLAALLARVGRRAPALRAVEGLRTAIVLTTGNAQPEAELHVDAAAYAAALEALAQARLAAEGAP